MKGENIILFDGACNLCNGFVQFIIRNDSKSVFQFASLQSDFGQKTISEHGLSPETINTTLLLEKGTVYQKSTAVIKIFKKMDFPINLLSGFILLPKRLRDTLYGFVSKRRFRISGKAETVV